MTLLLRDAAVTASDGRTLTIDLLTFDRPYFADDRPDMPGGYDEVWQRGAFRHQERAAHRIELRYRHRSGTRLGRGTSLAEVGPKLRATFRVELEPLELFRELMQDGAFPGASIGFEARPDWERVERAPGRRPRVLRSKGQIDETSLTPAGAYNDARPLSLREPQGAAPALSAWRVWLDFHAARPMR
jgi:HK97 family phage prohead protease